MPWNLLLVRLSALAVVPFISNDTRGCQFIQSRLSWTSYCSIGPRRLPQALNFEFICFSLF